MKEDQQEKRVKNALNGSVEETEDSWDLDTSKANKLCHDDACESCQ